MRFERGGNGRVGYSGMRNFRQALASPYPAVRFTVRRGHFFVGEIMRTSLAKLLVLSLFVLSTGACALRSPSIADLRANPVRFHNRTVRIEGVVTSSFGIPLVPFKVYRVDDGTGEVTVISQNSRTPTRGSRVRVKGQVDDVAVLGGQALGLHLKERSLSIRR